MATFRFKTLSSFLLASIAFACIAPVANAQYFNRIGGTMINLRSVSGWSGGGNATYMTRLNPNAVPILNQGGAAVVSADQLDFDFNLGYEAFITKSFDGGGKLELKFSALEDVTATYTSTITGGGLATVTNPVSPFFVPTPFVQSTTLDSEIMSGEMNLYVPLGPSTDWILGFRWIEYDETMTWSLGGVFHATDVDNHLYGFQTGLDTLLTSSDVFELSIFGKGGVYGNDADQVTTIPIVPVTGQSFDTTLAAVVDTGVKGKLKITDRVAINFGYNLLYLAGIGLAPDQLNTHSSVLGGFTSSRLDTSSAYYHGGFVGIAINK